MSSTKPPFPRWLNWFVRCATGFFLFACVLNVILERSLDDSDKVCSNLRRNLIDVRGEKFCVSDAAAFIDWLMIPAMIGLALVILLAWLWQWMSNQSRDKRTSD